MSGKMKCKIVTFEEVYHMVKKVADAVKASSYNPTTIVGLARGGWIPARLLCDFLGLTDLISLKVEHWLQTGMTKDEAAIKYSLTTNLTGKRILIVDDITDTGKSLITSTEYLKKLNPTEIHVATMQFIPGSKYKPDFYAEEVKTWTWFIYPWNWIEDSTTLIIRLIGTKKEKIWLFTEIKKGLKEFFEIQWDNRTLGEILKIMAERGQIEKKTKNKFISYKLKEEKVIQL